MMLILLNPLSRPDPSSHQTDRMKSLVLSSTAAVSGSGSPPLYPSAIRRHNGDTVSGDHSNLLQHLQSPLQ